MEQTGRLSRQIGSLLEMGTTAGLTDGQLLERFLTRESEAAEKAFASLVERHGPMVMRVCRSILADPHDAEDAFQATFLVLVRKSRSLWVEDSLGPWIHQVALRTASHARAAAQRRRRHESSAARAVDETTRTKIDDIAPVLHEEIGRLPERFRVPIVLCDLQEMGHDQVARHLGCPVGTIKSRLSRARQRLRERLLRRGFAPTAVVAGPPPLPRMNGILPEVLVSSTTRTACRYAVSRTILDGSAAILANGVLSAMSMTRWWKAACLLLVAGATVSGAGLLGGGRSQAVEPRPQDSGKPAADMPVAAATRGPFRLVVNDRGTLEATESEDLIARLPGNRTIGAIVAEGTMVKKGDAIVEFDSAGSRGLLTKQQIATQAAEASYQNAKLLRETAEIARSEYEEGIYPQDKAAIQSQIELARKTLKGAIDRQARLKLGQGKLDGLLREQEKRSSTDIMVEVDLQDRLDAAEQAVAREQSTLEQAESRLRILEKHTRPKTISQLRSEIEKARSHELSRKQALQIELDKKARLEKEVAACRLVAGIDGVVVYLEDPYHENPLRRVVIEKGALVHEGQAIARIVNVDASMQFNALVGEPLVDRLKVGQKAMVQIDAFPDAAFTGVVTSIAPRPAPIGRTRSGYKVYPTLIKLENGNKSLRPGMNGRAEVTIVEREDSLTIPFDAILTYQDRTEVAVKKPGGGFEWRGVVLGEGDPESKRVEIKEGLKPGEEVALKPIELLSEFEKRQKGIGEPSKTGRRKAAVDPASALPAQ